MPTEILAPRCQKLTRCDELCHLRCWMADYHPYKIVLAYPAGRPQSFLEALRVSSTYSGTCVRTRPEFITQSRCAPRAERRSHLGEIKLEPNLETRVPDGHRLRGSVIMYSILYLSISCMVTCRELSSVDDESHTHSDRLLNRPTLAPCTAWTCRPNQRHCRPALLWLDRTGLHPLGRLSCSTVGGGTGPDMPAVMRGLGNSSEDTSVRGAQAYQ